MNDPTVKTTDNLISAAESAVNAFVWCDALFKQIKKEAAELAGTALHIRDLADMGEYLAQSFGNDLDVAREDSAKEVQS